MEAELDVVKQRVWRLDLREPVKVAQEAGQWDDERARRAEKFYREFLFVSAVEGISFPMLNRDADDVWHAHILDTRKYRDDCQSISDLPIDHERLTPEAESAIDLEKALERWYDLTGERIIEPYVMCVMMHRRPPQSA